VICLSALGKSNPKFPTFSNHQYSRAFTTISHSCSFSIKAFVAEFFSKVTSNVLFQIFRFIILSVCIFLSSTTKIFSSPFHDITSGEFSSDASAI
jgi:hypothetical protein